MRTEHIIILEEVGGADVISCAGLAFHHIEHRGQITDDAVKRTICDYLHLPVGVVGKWGVFRVV